jgi:hypothetical protein
MTAAFQDLCDDEFLHAHSRHSQHSFVIRHVISTSEDKAAIRIYFYGLSLLRRTLRRLIKPIAASIKLTFVHYLPSQQRASRT